jgi:hypothetical protein
MNTLVVAFGLLTTIATAYAAGRVHGDHITSRDLLYAYRAGVRDEWRRATHYISHIITSPRGTGRAIRLAPVPGTTTTYSATTGAETTVDLGRHAATGKAA